jgi:hypothetical protein
VIVGKAQAIRMKQLADDSLVRAAMDRNGLRIHHVEFFFQGNQQRLEACPTGPNQSPVDVK